MVFLVSWNDLTNIFAMRDDFFLETETCDRFCPSLSEIVYMTRVNGCEYILYVLIDTIILFDGGLHKMMRN